MYTFACDHNTKINVNIHCNIISPGPYFQATLINSSIYYYMLVLAKLNTFKNCAYLQFILDFHLLAE